MNKNKILKTLELDIDSQRIEEFEKLFLQQNFKLNLISKNDEKLLFEKHIFDSLALNLFIKNQNLNGVKLLDIGTGGGFPALPLAICYKDIEITAVDSIRKKINAINEIKQQMNLLNLIPICDRVENIKGKFDIITSRAVAKMDVIVSYALPLLKKNGSFVAYKSKRYKEELDEAQHVLKDCDVSVIEYKLPLDEVYERYLVIVKKNC